MTHSFGCVLTEICHVQAVRAVRHLLAAAAYTKHMKLILERCPCEPDLLHRLCEPYVTYQLLERVFGDLANEVASKYFIEWAQNRYRFRSQFARCVCCLPLDCGCLTGVFSCL